MSYLLDICAISALRKKVPTHVIHWFENKDEDLFFISAVTLAELFDGVEHLPASKKRSDLEDWLHGNVLARFKDRILPIDEKVAKTWGLLSAHLKNKGINVGTQDLYIAATALVNSLAIVTLNLKDFKDVNISIFNPWEK
jgi:toxin FitB